MIKRYNPYDNSFEEVNLSNLIAEHSADKIIVYKKVDKAPLYMGYYFPKDYNQNKRYPVFIMIHGGAWSSHMIFEEQVHWQGDYLGYLARYYAQKGMVCVSVDYRLARNCGQTDNYGLIDCYEDCCDAMDAIIRDANQYGVDTDRMYLLGESAGGHLAGALATFHFDRSYGFKKVILINSITDLGDERWKRYVPVESRNPHLKDMSFEERVAFLSPLHQISKLTSDVILVHGENDQAVNVEHSYKFYKRMKEFSKGCELHLIENTKHAFLLAEYTKELHACKTGIGIINTILRKDIV